MVCPAAPTGSGSWGLFLRYNYDAGLCIHRLHLVEGLHQRRYTFEQARPHGDIRHLVDHVLQLDEHGAGLPKSIRPPQKTFARVLLSARLRCFGCLFGIKTLAIAGEHFGEFFLQRRGRGERIARHASREGSRLREMSLSTVASYEAKP